MKRGRAVWMMAAVVLIVLLPLLAWAEPLFPVPLHVQRNIVDGVDAHSYTVEQYCIGSRIITVSGQRTVIADYATGTLTEIDRDSATYSVTDFRELAAAEGRGLQEKQHSAAVGNWRTVGSRQATISGREADATELERSSGGAAERVTLVADRDLALSRDAFDALTGAAYPNEKTELHEVMAVSLRRGIAKAGAAPGYAFPLEVRWHAEVDGVVVETANRVTRIDRDLPPAGVLDIPAGARLVEAPRLRAPRILDELDHLPSTPAGGKR